MRSRVSKKILSETSNKTKEKAIEYAENKINCKHPREKRSYIGNNLLRCDVCGLEFS
jgi:epoxyqueuosine reductase QueG